MQHEPLRAQRPVAILLGFVALVEILLLAGVADWSTGVASAGGAASGPGANVEKLARSIFTRHLFAFEITSVLLVIAVVGAVVLARRPARTDDPEPEEVTA